DQPPELSDSAQRCPRRHHGHRAGPADLTGRRSSLEPGPPRWMRAGFCSTMRALRRPAMRNSGMTFVVTEACIKCKYTDCVEVCPVDCFHEGPNMLVIDPEECIDCTLCEPECPVEAIVSEDDVPAGQEQFLELNADLSK